MDSPAGSTTAPMRDEDFILFLIRPM